MRVEIKDNKLITPNIKDGVYLLEKFKKKRSSPQNAFLHGVLFKMAAEGMTKKTGKKISIELAKAVLKHQFLQKFTEVGTITIPTSKLNTTECMEFIEKCQQYCAEMLGVNIPSPNETSYSIMEQK